MKALFEAIKFDDLPKFIYILATSENPVDVNQQFQEATFLEYQEPIHYYFNVLSLDDKRQGWRQDEFIKRDESEINPTTLLGMACYLGRPEFVEMLVRHYGADVNQIDLKMYSPLQYLLMGQGGKNRAEIARLLISYNAHIHYGVSPGTSAYQIAMKEPAQASRWSGAGIYAANSKADTARLVILEHHARINQTEVIIDIPEEEEKKSNCLVM